MRTDRLDMMSRSIEHVFADRWPNFRPKEVLSPGCFAAADNDDELIGFIDEVAMDCLQALRDEMKCALYVNIGNHRRRGVRTFKEQLTIAKVQNAAKEIPQHCFGRAFDVTPEVIKDGWQEELAAMAQKIGFTGIGLYETFVHMDIRTVIDEVITWDARKQH